jgi:hypothetical protein
MCTGSGGTADPEEEDWLGPDLAGSEDPVDPAVGESSAIGDLEVGAVIVGEVEASAEDPRRPRRALTTRRNQPRLAQAMQGGRPRCA